MDTPDTYIVIDCEEMMIFISEETWREIRVRMREPNDTPVEFTDLFGELTALRPTAVRAYWRTSRETRRARRRFNKRMDDEAKEDGGELPPWLVAD